jgi:uncharacterized Ntn-hydrolase superfamily protein
VTAHPQTPSAGDARARARMLYNATCRAAHHTKADEAFYVGMFTAALTAADAAGYERARGEAVAVCKARAVQHAENWRTQRLDPERDRYEWYEIEADTCADAIAALAPPAGPAAETQTRHAAPQSGE